MAYCIKNKHSILRKNKIRILEDISIIGIDNLDFDQDMFPQLSSVDLQQQKICKCIVDFIVQRIKGEDTPAKKVIFQPTLVIRESSVNPACLLPSMSSAQ